MHNFSTKMKTLEEYERPLVKVVEMEVEGFIAASNDGGGGAQEWD